MKISLLAALAFAGLAAPLSAQPQEGGPAPEGWRRGPGGPGGRMLPTTRAEAERAATQRFEERDTDRDGFLTAAELGERGVRMLGRQDADHDGRISAAEATGGALAMFDRADADHDGRISDAERQAAMAAFGGRGRRARNLEGVPSTRVEMQQLVQALFTRQDANRDGFLSTGELGERADLALARLDNDHDGKLSAAENAVGLLSLFDRVDTDRDGTISPAERAAFGGPPQDRPGPSGE